MLFRKKNLFTAVFVCFVLCGIGWYSYQRYISSIPYAFGNFNRSYALCRERMLETYPGMIDEVGPQGVALLDSCMDSFGFKNVYNPKDSTSRYEPK